MKLLIYLFPALINVIMGGTYFITAYRLSAAGNSALPDLSRLGWTIGVGVITVCIVRTLWPYRGSLIGVDRGRIGLVLTAFCAVQAFTASALACFAWGAIGFRFYTGAVFYGVYTGSFYFLLVYHSLVHPSRAAEYVAVNEAVVEPLAGGWMAGGMRGVVSVSALRAAGGRGDRNRI